MANRMKFKEIVSFDEMLAEEDSAVTFGHKKFIGPLQQGIYFLLDNSYLLRLSGKVYRNPQ